MTEKINPPKIRLEASSLCQLKCHACPRSSKAFLSHVGNGYLRFQDFQKFLDENPGIAEIELSNYGEIFLNPDLLEILKYAYERKVILNASNGVNLNRVKSDVLEGLVKYRFRTMIVSIDGASNETYRRYRAGGNYEIVMKNIKQINLFKEQYRTKYPLLVWKFIAFGYNEHELPSAARLAEELNMDFRARLPWNPEFSPLQSPEVISELGAASRQEYRQKYGVDYRQGICYQLWGQPQINWDGKVLGCCRNFWGDFGGNAFRDGLSESLNNQKITYARDMLMGRKAPRDDIPCASCEIYLDMKREGKWVRRGLRGRILSPITSRVRILLKRRDTYR